MVGIICMLLTAFCWSLSGIIIKNTGQSAMNISCFGALAALLFNFVIYRGKKIVIDKFVVFVAIVEVFVRLTFIYANQHTSAGCAVALQYTSVLFVIFFEAVQNKKLPNWKQFIVVAVVSSGIFCLFYDGMQNGSILGNVVAVVSAVFFGAQFWLNTKEQAEPASSMTLSYVINSLILIPVLLRSENPVGIKDMFLMGLNGIIVCGFGGYFFNKGIGCIEAFSANLICILEIVLAPLWTYLLLNEKLSKLSLCGITIIVVSVILNLFLSKKESV